MPILVLAARLCPPGLESTIYSVLLSAYNLGLGLGSLVSAGLTAVREPVIVKYPVLLFFSLFCVYTFYLAQFRNRRRIRLLIDSIRIIVKIGFARSLLTLSVASNAPADTYHNCFVFSR